MKRFRLAGLTLCLCFGLCLSWEAAGVAQTSSSTTSSSTSGCLICDCNDQRSLCRMNCQTSSSDPSARVRCDVGCTRTFSFCVDNAYTQAKALQQAAQQSTSTSSTTTSTGATASGS